MYLEGKYATIIEKETKDNLKNKVNADDRGEPPTFKVDGLEEVGFEEPKKKRGRPRKLDTESIITDD